MHGADALLFRLSSPFQIESSRFVISQTPGINRVSGIGYRMRRRTACRCDYAAGAVADFLAALWCFLAACAF
ncbi:hypothetical protein CU280_11170 [Yersinia mollaretii]|nr:hypothetical protein CU280_11170 [Yersinia mollaretii]